MNNRKPVNVNEQLGSMIAGRIIRNILKVNQILLTRDGRKIGNALITKHLMAEEVYGIMTPMFEITTDYGDKVKMSGSEIQELFYKGGMGDDTHKNYAKPTKEEFDATSEELLYGRIGETNENI
jgi:hypothetical protein